jgi:Predicted metal-binding integral membrane protein
MAAFEITPRVRPIEGLDTAAAMPRGGRVPVVPAMITGAWMIVLVAQATGTAAALHHHALIEGGPSLWVALPLFLVAWQVMVVAMMLPASLPTIRVVEAAMGMLARPRRARAAFLGAFALIWAVFGLLAFMGDFVLHHVVDTTPWLAARPWLIEAGVLALAGGYQLVPLKQRSLAACRHPGDLAPTAPLPKQGAARLGLRHGLACLSSSWALMLVMFAAGFASLWSMAALTGLMVYETTGRYGHRAATAAGIVLILAALSTLAALGAPH